MFSIHRKLLLALKKVWIIKITPPHVPITWEASPVKFLIPLPLTAIWKTLGFWDVEHDRHNFLSFWTIFCPFTPLATRKIKLKKNPQRYHFTNVYIPEMTIIMYGSVIWSATDRIFCHFRLFFALPPKKTLKNRNFEKIKKRLEKAS